MKKSTTLERERAIRERTPEIARYWRITYETRSGKLRSVWATKFSESSSSAFVRFYLVDKYGEEYDPRQLVISTHGDVVKKIAVVLSLTYAELEVLS